MYLFTIIFIVTIGAIFLGVGLWHESIWWKRSDWHRGCGVIIGHEEDSGNDSTTYPPVVEYRFSSETHTFVSKYSSSKKPTTGAEVALRISPDGRQAEIDSLSDRLLFTLVPGGLGLMTMLLALSVTPGDTGKPEDQATRGAYHDPQTTSPVTGETGAAVEKVERFLKEAR